MEPIVHGGDIYGNEVKLDFSVNINPLGLQPNVKQALLQAVEECTKYPDIQHRKLKRAIACAYGIPQDSLFCGNGASELFLALVHGGRPKKVLLPVPSFYGYERAAAAVGAKILYHEMQEADGFTLTESVFPKIEKLEAGDMVFLTNPNNPVGNRIKESLLQELCEVCEQKKIVVVLDECFLEFTGKSGFLEQQERKFSNVVVIRAFTKFYAMPGVRLGFGFCQNPVLVQTIEQQLPEWNLSCFAEAAGIAALAEAAENRQNTLALIQRERTYLRKALQEMKIRVWQSETDFLLFFTELPLYEMLLKEGILIRDCSNFRGLGKGYYRIAVKTHTENEELVKVLWRYVCR